MFETHPFGKDRHNQESNHGLGVCMSLKRSTMYRKAPFALLELAYGKLVP